MLEATTQGPEDHVPGVRLLNGLEVPSSDDVGGRLDEPSCKPSRHHRDHDDDEQADCHRATFHPASIRIMKLVGEDEKKMSGHSGLCLGASAVPALNEQ